MTGLYVHLTSNKATNSALYQNRDPLSKNSDIQFSKISTNVSMLKVSVYNNFEVSKKFSQLVLSKHSVSMKLNNQFLHSSTFSDSNSVMTVDPGHI